MLIIDDVADDVEIYGSGLTFAGFDVDVRSTVSDAIDNPPALPPDVIVLDLGPTSTWSDCDRLCTAAAYANVPFVLITVEVRADRRNRDRAGTTPNCAAFVGKPCTHADLAAVLERVLRGERGIEYSTGLKASEHD